ncbi:MAG: hypothetical protein LBE03_01940 [Candidatus Nomurabacteria bacterium]|nr:hypothetical protein [Candidatus Nomurabacteria bacterium]
MSISQSTHKNNEVSRDDGLTDVVNFTEYSQNSEVSQDDGLTDVVNFTDYSQ